MAYINFKEEKVVVAKELKNRRNNNHSIFIKLREDNSKIDIDKYEKYSFKTTSNRTLNTSKTQLEDEFIEINQENIICAHFINCKFYNIKFVQCRFIGCTFEECDFGGGGVIFENCTFVQEEIKKISHLNKKENLSCDFIRCKIYSKFANSNVSYSIFEECSFLESSFELSDFTSSIIISCEINKLNIVDSDLSGIKIVGSYILDLEFNDKLKSKLDEKSFIDKIKLRKKDKVEYEGVYTVYQNIANKFKENTLDNNFGEYYYLCKCVQRGALNFPSKVCSYIYFITSGYGERILFPLISSIAITFIFALLYLILGMDIDGELVKYISLTSIPSTFRTLSGHLKESLNLSVAMFGGVGVIRSMPTISTYIIADIEMIIGIIMMGIGIGTLTRKLVR